MSKNVFYDQPEFINDDPRVLRPSISGTAITKELMTAKQSILLPPQLIKGKRILDLGSCNAASGAWVLSHGAQFYKGIEVQKEFVKSSEKSLSKYYDKTLWSIEEGSIEDFLNKESEPFDLVIASGVLHVFSNPLDIIKKLTHIARAIVIESSHPSTFQKTKFMQNSLKNVILNSKDYVNYIENESFIEMGIEGMTIPEEQTLLFNGLRPSMGAIKYSIVKEGFSYIDEVNIRLKKYMPKIYSPYSRFGILFLKEKEIDSGEFGFTSASLGKSSRKLYKW